MTKNRTTSLQYYIAAEVCSSSKKCLRKRETHLTSTGEFNTTLLKAAVRQIYGHMVFIVLIFNQDTRIDSFNFHVLIYKIYNITLNEVVSFNFIFTEPRRALIFASMNLIPAAKV